MNLLSKPTNLELLKVILANDPNDSGYSISNSIRKIKFTQEELTTIKEQLGMFNDKLPVVLSDKLAGLTDLNPKLLTPASGNKLITKRNTWEAGDDSMTQSINTSYTQFKAMMVALNLPKGTHVVDVGCCLGRLGLLIGELYPDIKYTGYEFWKERIEQASQIAKERYKNVKYVHQDLTDEEFKLKGDVFFMYLPNDNRDLMNKIVNKVVEVSKSKDIILAARHINDYVMEYFPTIEPVKTIGTGSYPIQLLKIPKGYKKPEHFCQHCKQEKKAA